MCFRMSKPFKSERRNQKAEARFEPPKGTAAGRRGDTGEKKGEIAERSHYVL